MKRQRENKPFTSYEEWAMELNEQNEADWYEDCRNKVLF